LQFAFEWFATIPNKEIAIHTKCCGSSFMYRKVWAYVQIVIFETYQWLI
jgi:hypothetical protein